MRRVPGLYDPLTRPRPANLYRTGHRAPLGCEAQAAATGAPTGAQGQAAMHCRSDPRETQSWGVARISPCGCPQPLINAGRRDEDGRCASRQSVGGTGGME
jgi:hypothetical protein